MVIFVSAYIYINIYIYEFQPVNKEVERSKIHFFRICSRKCNSKIILISLNIRFEAIQSAAKSNRMLLA